MLPALLLLGCASPDPAGPRDPGPGDLSDDRSPTPAPALRPLPEAGLPWSDDPCAGLQPHHDWSAELDTWEAQGAPDGTLLLAGSSSIRRWEHARRDLVAWGPVQRGLGGAWLSDVAAEADRWVLAQQPDSVVVFAGTNDLNGGADVDAVIDSYRCLVQRIFDGQGPTPVVFVGITPTLARWDDQPRAVAVDAAVQALCEAHPDLHYADVPSRFLALGAPPPASLFVADGLHLSAEGYALWTEAILEALGPVDERAVPFPGSQPDGPFVVRVDLGPSSPPDGAPAPPIDAFGLHWNSWHPLQGGERILAGEVLHDLQTTRGALTGLDLVITGGFRTSQAADRGLLAPDGALLGTLAVPEATSDFLYSRTLDDPAGLSLTGLDPARTYTLRLFGSTASSEARRTRYTVEGGGEPRTEILTTTHNTDTVLVFSDLLPDAWGELHVDAEIEAGPVATLSLLELEGA